MSEAIWDQIESKFINYDISDKFPNPSVPDAFVVTFQLCNMIRSLCGGQNKYFALKNKTVVWDLLLSKYQWCTKSLAIKSSLMCSFFLFYSIIRTFINYSVEVLFFGDDIFSSWIIIWYDSDLTDTNNCVDNVQSFWLVYDILIRIRDEFHTAIQKLCCLSILYQSSILPV